MKSILSKYKVYQWIVFGVTIAINLFIIINSCLPAAESSSQSGWVSDVSAKVINTFKPGTINDNNFHSFTAVIRKAIGHFGLFLSAGIFNTLSLKYIYSNKYRNKVIFIYILIFYGLFLGGLTENIQLLIPGRSGETKDVMIDFLGYLIGIFITLIPIIIIDFRKQKTIQ